MFVKRTQDNSYLVIGSDFFRISEVRNNGDVVVNVVYSVNQRDAIRLNATSVKIDVYASPPVNSYRSNDILPMDQPRAVAAHVLQLTSNIKKEIQQSKSKQNLLVSIKSDISSKVNNELVTTFMNAGNNEVDHVSLFKRRIVYRTVGEIAASGENAPLMQAPVVSGSGVDHTHNDLSIAMLGLIYKGQDPSDVVRYAGGNTTTYHALGGMVQPYSPREEFGPMKKLVDAYIGEQNTRRNTDDLEDNHLVPVVEQEKVELIEINEALLLPFSKIKDKPGEVTINFQLIDNTNLVLDLVGKTIDIMKHINVFNAPRQAPTVTAQQRTEFGRANLKIMSSDDRIAGVKIYKKVVNSTYYELEPYSLVKQLPITKGQLLTVPVEFSDRNPDVFRVTAIGKNGAESAEFTNVVLRPSKPQENRRLFVSLAARPVKEGVQLEAHDIPPNVVSFQIMRRDKTIFQKEATAVGNRCYFAAEENESYVAVDDAVRPFHVYEYYLKLILDNGLEKTSGNTMIEYYPFVDNMVDTTISNFKTSILDRKLNVEFSVASKIVETDLATIKNLLVKQNLLQFFHDDVLNERAKLEQLIAHYIIRVNLTTGEREEFGVCVDTQFSDEKESKINAIQPLKLGHRYRYEISACLRAPETLLSDYTKETQDKNSKKTYSFKPSVYQHPVALRQGNITNEQTLKAYHARHTLMFGYVGNVTSIDASFSEDTVRISDATAFRFERNSNMIRFEISGDKQLVDHFVILKEVLGVKTAVGKAHALGPANYVEYIHDFGHEELGQLFYHIIPVFNNYRLGTAIQTNDVVV